MPHQSYSAAFATPATRVRVRIVTNSSAEVGWMPMVRSKSALVAPATIATSTACIISGASSPRMCTPSTRWR